MKNDDEELSRFNVLQKCSIAFGVIAIFSSIPLSISLFWLLALSDALTIITLSLSVILVVLAISSGILGNRNNDGRKTIIGYYLAVIGIVLGLCLYVFIIFSFIGFKDI